MRARTRLLCSCGGLLAAIAISAPIPAYYSHRTTPSTVVASEVDQPVHKPLWHPPPSTTTTTVRVVPPKAYMSSTHRNLAPIPQKSRISTASVHNATVSEGGLYAEWSKVAVCEEGGWIGAASSWYPDSLGINRTNWQQFGGGSDVSPSAQIAVATRLITYYHAPIPDQYGCQRGGW